VASRIPCHDGAWGSQTLAVFLLFLKQRDIRAGGAAIDAAGRGGGNGGKSVLRASPFGNSNFI
jgi:hypothetical protein